MKKLIVLSLLVLSQIALAGPTAREGEVRRLTVEQARSRVQASDLMREIERAKAEGKDIMSDATLRPKVERAITIVSKKIDNISGEQKNSLLKLINVNAIEVMTEMTRLSSITTSTSASAKEKAMAKKSLELMTLAANSVSSVVRNSAEARTQQANVAKIVEVSRKISSLDFGTASDAFVAKYEQALREGKSVDQAVRIASNNKFGVKELRDCE